ncbi:hypothetical protein ElP_49060 [Tautonia plasticadhaerens]|uniref:Primase C-terminal 1 domain-containing protein n=1 Tax=Tautonia plasticadhaerens TaxID=2527974 RepID=A0A518H831_9BACT|nr:hypothetical protein ElP_49060 [Tautonia plasticadhaerens]
MVAGHPLNIYCSANPRSRHGGSSRNDVRLARCLFSDLEHIGVEAAVESALGAGLPPPTMTVGSGHGVHLYWRLLEPIIDLSLWTVIQKLLIRALGSDPGIHDPARVMRLPGFMNVNGDPAPATIAEADPSRRYELDEILSALPPLGPSPELPGPARSASPAAKTFPLFGEEHQTNLQARMTAYLEEVEPPSDGERNIRLFGQAARLVEKYDPEEDDLLAAIGMLNARTAEPLDDSEVDRVVRNAYRHVHAKGMPRGTLLNVVHEPYQEPEGEIFSLARLRESLAEARLEGLGKPGSVFYDGSMTGVGKSTADRAAMLEAGKSLTVLPTHHACEELAQALAGAGLDAASYPPIDASTCRKFESDGGSGEARMALDAGLNVGEAVCPDCPHQRSCEYQRRRERARNAAHAVATHARASSGGFSIAEGRPVVFIHEDPLALLRPMVKVTARPVGPQASHVDHLRQVVRLARAAVEVSEQLGDVQKVVFTRHLARSAQGLVVELEDQAVVEHFRAAERDGAKSELPRVRAIPSKEPIRRPERCDYLLYRAMRASGIDPDRDALRLALAHACGELAHLCVVVEDTYTKAKDGETGGRRDYHKALVGVWKVDPPEGAVAWFEDATGDRALLEEMLGRPVQDRTPAGRPEYRVPPVQYTSADVTQKTSENVVRGLVRGLIAGHPDARKVGVITHRGHLAALESLEPSWSSRIARKEYFRSGKDRASNSWMDCDLILVLGTPRVPPAAVRDWLVRTGRIDAAGKDGGWGNRRWEGKAAEGSLIRVDGHGYADPSWRSMNNSLVRASLLQAVGRGRGVTEQGVPVVVVSDENLGLPLSAIPVPEIKDSEARTFSAFRELTAINAKYDIVGEIAVTAAELARHLGDVKERQVRNHLTHLTQLGLLAKKGERGGWTLAR